MGWNYKPTKPLIVRQCLGKERMQEWEAKLKAKRLRKSGTACAHHYQCGTCGGWHVTSSAKTFECRVAIPPPRR